MDLIARLTEEHQDYVIKLSTLAETVERIRINGRGDYFVETLDGLLVPLTTELDDHARREEDFLFPRILERAPDSPIPVMLEDHEAIREASQGFASGYLLWRDGDDDAFDRWATFAETLRGTFSAHMQKENLILFPLARRVLSAAEIARLVVEESR
ncbi:MAG: hemerythrin domain-containing protein [Sulfobacillus sp.]|nr:hemerythrin domain-containing protein [Sulfobacillus sp.]